MYRIEHGKIRPSKALADSMVAMLQGNAEFLMIDDQKLVYETALDLAARASGNKATDKKQVANFWVKILTKKLRLPLESARRVLARWPNFG